MLGTPSFIHMSDGGTVATPVEKPATATEATLSTPWDVVVYNDPVNLMSFVTYAFRKVFGYTEEHAHRLMLEIHKKGKSIVWSGEKEKAEFYVQQLQGLQLLAALKRAS
jgi:ATP-dependent Clp protease adaptor protein ClpS